MGLEIGVKKAYLVFDEKTRYYFTGLNSSDGYLVVSDEGKTLFIDSRYFSYAKEFLNGKVNVELYSSLKQVFDFLLSKGIEEIFVDFSLTTVAEYERLKKFGIKISDSSEVLTDLKMVKTEKEISLIKKSCDIAYEAFVKTLPVIKPGVTEKYVAYVLEDNMRKLGASGTSFDT
ncbi:MAG: aminopeptidase P family N-terminal domain-containing protein, partial [Clostridia bacterium]|nr:aminopeptidase P family N-terminal domain-containing protein [Clostridia bacterium]